VSTNRIIRKESKDDVGGVGLWGLNEEIQPDLNRGTIFFWPRGEVKNNDAQQPPSLYSALRIGFAL